MEVFQPNNILRIPSGASQQSYKPGPKYLHSLTAEGFRMKTDQQCFSRIIKLGMLLMAGASMSACVGLLDFGGASWKEEVLMHDGSTIIVTRTQRYGGRHELGQEPPVSEEEVSFIIPGEENRITWMAKYSERAGRAELNLLALHVVRNEAYIVARTPSCVEYAKWGRPNPPYVLFKYTNADWKVIPMVELPGEIEEPNVVRSTFGNNDVERAKKTGFISSKRIKELNIGSTAPQLKKIYHVPIDRQGTCPLPTGPGGLPISPSKSSEKG